MNAFVPFPLPPADPPLEVGGPLAHRLGLAEEALRRLDPTRPIIPSLDWFLYAFVRKEAVISSQIEGTQATLTDLLKFESDQSSPATADVEEICNHLAALEYARAEMARPNGLPISMRLLNEAHRRLLQGTRGAGKQPGEIRTTQNWIGGSRPGNASYVPPPPHHLGELLGEFERYLHTAHDLPPLIRAGLLHAQFETIHPYLDGNGRIGRLLVTLLLEQWKLLSAPLLYLSLHFKRHRAEYYRRLDAVRTDGDWEGWLDFFLDGVATIGEEARATAHDLSRLVETDREKVNRMGGRSAIALRLFNELPQHPIVTAKTVMGLLSVSKPTAGRAIELLTESGVLREQSGRRRDRWYAYADYLDRLAAEAP